MILDTMLRGFKVPLKVLDAFLTENGIPEEHEALCMGTIPSSRDDSDILTALLRVQGLGCQNASIRTLSGVIQLRVQCIYRIRLDFCLHTAQGEAK